MEFRIQGRFWLSTKNSSYSTPVLVDKKTSKVFGPMDRVDSATGGAGTGGYAHDIVRVFWPIIPTYQKLAAEFCRGHQSELANPADPWSIARRPGQITNLPIPGSI